MTIDIHDMTPQDHPAILEVARSLAIWFKPLDQMTLAIDLKEHEGLVARQEGQVVGFLLYHVLDPTRAELSWLGVAPASHSRGIGTRLLAALETRVARRGVHRLQVNTVPADHDTNFAATNDFYLKQGFLPISRDDHFYAHQRPGIRLEKQLEIGDKEE